MKKLILLLSLIVCSVFCKAQTPNWLWGEPADGTGYGYCSGLALGPNDTLYMVGREGGTVSMGGQTINTPGQTFPFICKLDTNYPANPNNAKWLEPGLNSGFDYVYGECSDKENNLYCTGDENSGGSAYVVKYNQAGVVVGTNNTNVGNGQGTGVVVDNAQNIYETGNYDGTPTFGTATLPYGGSAWAGFLTKFDSTLNPIWAAYFSATDGSNSNYVTGKSVALDLQGNVYVVGSYQGAAVFYSANGGPSIAAPVMPDGSGTSGNLFVAKYDSSGVVQWVINAPNAGMDWNSWGYVNKIKVDSCGNLYVAGYFENTALFGTFSVTCNNGSNDMFVAKFNTKSMVWEWVETGLGNGSTYATDIALDKTSNVYVVGAFVAPATFGDTVLSSGANFIAKYNNSNGSLQWIQSANISGQSAGVSGVVVDGQNYAYIDGTYSGSSSSLGSVTLPNAPGGSDFLAKLDTVPPRIIAPVISSSYCAGSTVNIPYSIIGIFNPGNTFTAQLSDSTGSFSTYTSIGSTTTTTGGDISVTIPSNTTPGSTYLIRVVSSNPPTSSLVNGCGYYYQKGVYTNDFYVTIGNNIIVPVSDDTTLCSGGSVLLTAGTGSGLSYKWYTNTDTTTLSTADTITVIPTVNTTYYVGVTNNTNCTGLDSVVVKIGSAGTLTVSTNPSTGVICPETSATLKVDKSGTNYNWTPSAGLSASTGDSITANPSITTTYTVTGNDSLGCAVSDSVVVAVDSKDTLIILPQPPPSFCSGSFAELQVSSAGINAIYTWIPSTGLSASTGDSVLASPTATTTYTVSGNDSLGCAATGTEKVDVFPAPIIPTLTQLGDSLKSSAHYQNQWYFNGKPLTGDTSQYLAITAGGEYWVSVTNEANGCSSASDSMNITAGINQLSVISDQLTIYPNPFNTTIFIKINSSAQDVKDWNLQITDVLGRTVYSKQSLDYSNDIDLSNLSSGMYFITVINKTGRAVFPVVRQN